MRKPEHISQKDWDAVDSLPLTDEKLANMRPASEVLSPALYKALTEKRMGRPPVDNPKQQIISRLDADVLAHFKAQGKGY